MKICVGIPGSFPFFSAIAAELGAPTLVSANAFRNKKNNTLRTPKPTEFIERPRFDSAGFVAMKLFGGYPWTREEHVRAAGAYPWVWWAARDFCCEREVAKDRLEVRLRVIRTAGEYKTCIAEALRQGVSLPMPVLQGWDPEDYELCAALMGELPPLVGVGSVCRRHLKGRDGLLSVVAHLDRVLPKHVRLHLFGVKSAGIRALRGHPRIESVDSMAWDFAAATKAIRQRWADKLAGRPPFKCTLEFRASCLREWYSRQLEFLT